MLAFWTAADPEVPARRQIKAEDAKLSPPRACSPQLVANRQQRLNCITGHRVRNWIRFAGPFSGGWSSCSIGGGRRDAAHPRFGLFPIFVKNCKKERRPSRFRRLFGAICVYTGNPNPRWAPQPRQQPQTGAHRPLIKSSCQSSVGNSRSVVTTLPVSIVSSHRCKNFPAGSTLGTHFGHGIGLEDFAGQRTARRGTDNQDWKLPPEHWQLRQRAPT